MKRIFVDANIVIDLLCERYPWFPSVMRIFSMADRGQIELLLFIPFARYSQLPDGDPQDESSGYI